ncbi:hypothetical protein NQ317_002504 [Molorchus minor]|uniref:Uncharacterized protein n=1 Tax=Molorchus minor TaxID=1323400 RepID=A0ABQ9IZJ4_9CUCU|nr:hypothetical protein NQ317_002504 [Molorchus minor]
MSLEVRFRLNSNLTEITACHGAYELVGGHEIQVLSVIALRTNMLHYNNCYKKYAETSTCTNHHGITILIYKQMYHIFPFIDDVKKDIIVFLLYNEIYNETAIENLEDDSTNWMFYKIMGKKLMLRSDVPHRNSNNQYRQSVNRLGKKT